MGNDKPQTGMGDSGGDGFGNGGMNFGNLDGGSDGTGAERSGIINPNEIYVGTERLADHLECLRTRQGGWWKWAAHARSIGWPDGRTIVFRSELADVLERLDPNSLPTLPQALLLLAATRSGWSKELAQQALRDSGVGWATCEYQGSDVVSSIIERKFDEQLQLLFEGIENVVQLPVELKESVAAKVAIFHVVFTVSDDYDESGDLKTNAITVKAVQSLRQGIDVGTLKPKRRYQNVSELIEELSTLIEGLKKVSAVVVERVMQTGLEDLPSAVELPNIDPAKVREALNNLRSDLNLSGIAKVATQLMSVLHLPRQMVIPQNIPGGGVSDISNRGPLDRLLLSELANDDVTLLTRVVMREALYIRRESPATRPPVSRMILLDRGLRMWGVPKLFGMAVALALAAMGNSEGNLRIYQTADACEPERIDLSNPPEITRALEGLDPHPSPHTALLKLNDRIDNAQEDLELFLVTHADVLEDPTFCAAISAVSRTIMVATVSSEGQFSLTRISGAGRLEVCQIQLSLNDLFSVPTVQATKRGYGLRLADRDPSLPEIFHLETFPLLLPAVLDYRQTIDFGEGQAFGATHDGRLMLFRGWREGGHQLSEIMASGRSIAVGQSIDEGTLFHVACNAKKNQICIHSYERDTEVLSRKDVNFGRVGDCVIRDDHVMLCGNDAALMVDLKSDMRREFAVSIGMRHLNSRFYAAHGGQLMAADPVKGFIDAGKFGKLIERYTEVEAVFDRPGHGPWVMYSDLTVAPVLGSREVFPELKRRLVLRASSGRNKFLGISQDGNRILAKFEDIQGPEQGFFLIDLSASSPSWKYMGRQNQIHEAYRKLAVADSSGSDDMSVCATFSGIGVSEDGALVLKRRPNNGFFESLQIDRTAGCKLVSINRIGLSKISSFHQIGAPKGVKYALYRADFRDGSVAYLDGRGAVHLVSSDRRIPQITLALTKTSVAGWTTEGHTFGWKYFHGSEPTVSCEIGLEFVARFTRRLE